MKLSIRSYDRLTVKVGRSRRPVGICSSAVTYSRAAQFFADSMVFTASEHIGRSARLRDLIDRVEKIYDAALDRAMYALEGRPFRPQDYRTSAVGCDRFPTRTKETLRRLAHLKAKLHDIAAIHNYTGRHFAHRCPRPEGRS